MSLVVVSLASDVGATLAVLDSGATSPAMRRLRKASRGSQLFGLMLPRCTTHGRGGTPGQMCLRVPLPLKQVVCGAARLQFSLSEY